jgi:hypothetical protein
MRLGARNLIGEHVAATGASIDTDGPFGITDARLRAALRGVPETRLLLTIDADSIVDPPQG